MPKTKTLLDELVRTLNVRKDAWGRYNRRKHAIRNYPNWEPEYYGGGSWLYENAPLEIQEEVKRLQRNVDDAESLLWELGNKAEDQYREFLRSRPGKKALQRAWYEMPDDVREDYIDTFGSLTNFR